MMETVAFYSYKGGVGRSLLLVNTARFLALSGRRVVALDLDFEAPGLHYKLGVEGKVNTGAVRLLQRSLDGDLPTLDELRDATVEVPMPATHGGWLRLLAAGPAPKGEYWADLGRLQGRLAASQDAGLLEAMLDLQSRIEEAWNPDVLLVDARTGVTGLGGVATMALCDRVVLMTTRAKESLDGIRAVAESLRATPTLRGGERRLEFVVSRVQGTEAVDERELREVLGEYFELPHDRYDGGAERLLGDDPPSRAQPWRATRSSVDSLLARTLTWISKLFPTHADEANRARDRLAAVDEQGPVTATLYLYDRSIVNLTYRIGPDGLMVFYHDDQSLKLNRNSIFVERAETTRETTFILHDHEGAEVHAWERTASGLVAWQRNAAGCQATYTNVRTDVQVVHVPSGLVVPSPTTTKGPPAPGTSQAILHINVKPKGNLPF